MQSITAPAPVEMIDIDDDWLAPDSHQTDRLQRLINEEVERSMRSLLPDALDTAAVSFQHESDCDDVAALDDYNDAVDAVEEMLQEDIWARLDDLDDILIEVRLTLEPVDKPQVPYDKVAATVGNVVFSDVDAVIRDYAENYCHEEFQAIVDRAAECAEEDDEEDA